MTQLLFLTGTLFLDLHLVGGSRDVVIAPLDEQNVVTALPNHVVHLIVVPARVLDLDLLAGTLGPVDAHVQDVVACEMISLLIY